MASASAIPVADDPVPATEGGKADEKLCIESRFGTIEFQRDKVITFTHGMLGFPAHLEFAIADLPGEISFPVLPLESLPGLIKDEDIKEALQVLSIPVDQAVVLLIATARKEQDRVQLSVNLRAPIFLNAETRSGRQLVLSNNEYPIRHML